MCLLSIFARTIDISKDIVLEIGLIIHDDAKLK